MSELLSAADTIQRMRHGMDVGISGLAEAVSCNKDCAKRAIYAGVKRGDLVKVRHGTYRRSRPRAFQEPITGDEVQNNTATKKPTKKKATRRNRARYIGPVCNGSKFTLAPVHEQGAITIYYDGETLGLVCGDEVRSLRASEFRALAAGLEAIASLADADGYRPIQERTQEQ